MAEVATVVDKDEEGSRQSINESQMKSISHLVVVKISEVEDEADFNNEVTSLSFNVMIVINLVTSVISVEHRRWKKEVILQ